jgi:ACS family hexuronate transporter-like MFS transporter
VTFTLLAAAASLIPFAGSGWLMVALLYIAGAGILGLHPYYYSLTQELSAKRMGIFSGGLAAWGWIASSLNQILVGRHIEATRSYELGLMIVGLAPVVGLGALLLFWPRQRFPPIEP